MINHPLEVVMVEMQSKSPAKKTGGGMGMLGVGRAIYQMDGMRGFVQGMPVRAVLNCYVTVCMVYGSQYMRHCVSPVGQQTTHDATT